MILAEASGTLNRIKLYFRHTSQQTGAGAFHAGQRLPPGSISSRLKRDK